MSGIAAIYDPRGLVEREDISSLLGAIRHRGRSELTYFAEGVGLGQRLLATTPESLHECLPIEKLGGRYQVVLDGRLDNREDLERALAIDSRAPLLTDPDLIVLAYDKWGAKAVERLVGDFAFVLWDTQERRLFAARDQRGFRPLVYARLGNRTIIGSEPHQLFALPAVRREVNDLYLACHLTGAALPSGQTPYQGVFEVSPGHFLDIRGNHLSVHEYWRFEPRPQLKYESREEFVEHFKELYGRVTKATVRTTQAPGILLSGGHDSSYIAGTVAPLVNGLKAYTGYKDSSLMDERPYSRAVVEMLGIESNEYDLDDCWSLSSNYMSDEDFDQPDLPAQGSMMIKAAETAKGSINVMLFGMGGDEFFRGPDEYITELAIGGHWLRTAQELQASAKYLNLPLKTVTTERLLKPAFPKYVREMLRREKYFDLTPRWLKKTTMAEMGLGQALELVPEGSVWNFGRTLTAFWSRIHSREIMSLLRWWERHVFLPRGIEVRAPLWDVRVVDFFLSTPGWVHRSGSRRKMLLRGAMEGLVPALVLERNDKGVFNDIVNRGVIEEETTRIDEALESSPLTDLPYVDSAVLSRDLAWQRNNPSRYPWYPFMWSTTAGLWLKAEQVSRGPNGRLNMSETQWKGGI